MGLFQQFLETLNDQDYLIRCSLQRYIKTISPHLDVDIPAKTRENISTLINDCIEESLNGHPDSERYQTSFNEQWRLKEDELKNALTGRDKERIDPKILIERIIDEVYRPQANLAAQIAKEELKAKYTGQELRAALAGDRPSNIAE